MGTRTDIRDGTRQAARAPALDAAPRDARTWTSDKVQDAERELFGRASVSVTIGRRKLKQDALAAGITYQAALRSRIDQRQQSKLDPIARFQERREARRQGRPAGHRRDHDPRLPRATQAERINRTLTDLAIYRVAAVRDLTEAHFGGNPYSTRRAIDQMKKEGLVLEHEAKGPKGQPFKVLTATETGARAAGQTAAHRGLDPEQRTWGWTGEGKRTPA